MIRGAAHGRHGSRAGAHHSWFVRWPEELSAYLREQQAQAMHFAKITAVAGAALLALAAVGWLVGVALRRRVASRAVRLRVLLPDEFDREGLVGFFRTLASLLHPRLGLPSSVVFTISNEGQRLEAELCCVGVFAPQVVAALKAAIRGVGVEP